jgi:hypothetical protein
MTSAHRRDFTVTRFGITAPSHPGLNTVMEIDRVIRVLPGRAVTAPDTRNRASWAPEAVISLDKDGQVTAGGEEGMTAMARWSGWNLMYGYSGQQGGRDSALMHPSEFIGGRMADDILDNPGLYVALAVTGLYPPQEAEERGSDDPIGWVVARKREEPS